MNTTITCRFVRMVVCLFFAILFGLTGQGCKTKVKGTTNLENQVSSLNDNLNDVEQQGDQLSTDLNNLGNQVDGLNDQLNNLGNVLNQPQPTPSAPGLPKLSYTLEVLEMNYSQAPVREVQNDFFQDLFYVRVTADNQDEDLQNISLAFSHHLPAVELVRMNNWAIVGYGDRDGSSQSIAPVGTSLHVVPQGTSETFLVRAHLYGFDRELLLRTTLKSVTTQDGWQDVAVFDLHDEVLVERGPEAMVQTVTPNSYTVDSAGPEWQDIARFRVTDTGDTGLLLSQAQCVLDTANAVELRLVDENGAIAGKLHVDSWQPNPAETVFWAEFYGISVPNLSGRTLTLQVNVITSALPASLSWRLNWLWVENPSNDTYRYAEQRDQVTSTVTVTPTP